MDDAHLEAVQQLERRGHPGLVVKLFVHLQERIGGIPELTCLPNVGLNMPGAN